MKDIPLPSTLLPNIVKMGKVLGRRGLILSRFLYGMIKQDFEELYTMIFSESPPLNTADDILQKVCCHVHNKHTVVLCINRARDGSNYS